MHGVVRQLDHMARVEFIDVLKNFYVGKDKYIEVLNKCLEGDEFEYNDEVRY